MLEQYKEAGGQLQTSDSILEFLKAYQRGFKISRLEDKNIMMQLIKTIIK